MNDAVPQDLEAEEAVLGAALQAPKILGAMLGPDHGLRAEHFYREGTGRLFSAMAGMSERGEPIDRITLIAECKRLALDPTFVDYVDGAVPDIGNWPAWVRSIKGAARRRSLIEASYLLQEAAYDDKPALIAEAERLLGEHEANASVYTPERQAEAFLEGDMTPVLCKWPWYAFNELTGGIRSAQTIFVFAWTNHGKSPIIDDILLTAHRDDGIRAALYINEMSPEERTMRFAAQLTDAGFENIRDDKLDPAERMRVANVLSGQSIPILNVAGWTAEDVCRDVVRSGWQIVGVDGLHMFEHEGEADLTRMALAFAQCAKRTGCTFVIAGHLNEKRAEEGTLPPPVLRDIRGSGHIKNVADFVVFLHREQTEDGFPLPGSRIWLGKGRNSALSGTRAKYDGAHMKFDA